MTNNTFKFYRGYTGHEHLPEFNLINMNGRVYDPVLGRFLSPDPYVQMPDFSQNFNRYTYCLNNPFKYVDPSGEIVWFVPVIIGAVIGAYSGGVMANSGQYNPTKWDYSSGKTWGYMLGGAAIGGVSGYLGASVASGGGFMANTMGIMVGSSFNSMGMATLSGGSLTPSISFGVASYNFGTGKWGYLGKKGNKWYEDVGYGAGAFANLADLGKAGNLLLNTEKKDIINHSAILDENGNTIISEGPGKNWIQPKGTIDHYLNRFLGGSGATNEYPVHGENMPINNVNIATIKNYGKVLNFLTKRGDGVVPYSFLYSSCSTHTGLALNLAGIPTLFLHPYTVQASVWVWNAGITPALINNSYYLQNYR
ncbi:RHS repeat-associated core domain-containing protein [Viscerimonas tarda]